MMSVVAQRQKINPVARLPVDWCENSDFSSRIPTVSTQKSPTQTSSSPRNFIVSTKLHNPDFSTKLRLHVENPDSCSRTSAVAYRSDFTIIAVDLGGLKSN
ncbi:MLO-like protein 6 [Dorcoceras hygrometricum]|uniref:MLO-like protein 6 n=1 Tax=Dorcoceras hygrometricum TaxID=472368 RepID=A0A2Z7AG50_9LAMI|nr:MLO-like protein 6 [Dorcoceras hygrometricum]